MDISALLIFAGTVALVAGSPGPSLAALVARVISRGYRGVIPFLAAMWIGEAIWLAFAVFGLAMVAQTFHWAFLTIKYAGLAYLAYLAYARRGEVLPQKTTYFFPKLVTGLLFQPL